MITLLKCFDRALRTSPRTCCKTVLAVATMLHKDPSKCPLLQALTTPLGWCNKRQMPRGGPFVTATGYSATLQDGTVVTGTKIVDDITWWLTHGMPEK